MEDVEYLAKDPESLTENGKEGNIILAGEGIDFNKLCISREAEFEIDLDVYDQEYSNPYFDKEEVFKNLNLECCEIDEDTGTDEKTPFECMAISMEDISPTQDRGIMKKVLKHGIGNVVPAGSLVRVHYNGYLEFSEEPFDSSRLRGKPEKIGLGTGEQILGWEIGMGSMKKGETARFLISPAYAYGRMGCPPRIPADSSVMFEIELLNFVDRGAADEYNCSSHDIRSISNFEKMFKVAKSLREVGNEAFKHKKNSQALKSYRKAADLIEKCRLANEDEENCKKELCLILYLNACLCCLNLREYGKSAMFAKQALQIDQRNVKALFRLGKAQLLMGETERSRKSLLDAQRYDPGNKEIRNELLILEDHLTRHHKMEKSMYGKMFQTEEKTGETVEKSLKDDLGDGLLNYAIEKISAFKTNPNETELRLPACLNSMERRKICQLAEGMQLAIVEDNDENMFAVMKQGGSK